MNKYLTAAFTIPVALAVVPVAGSAEEVEFIKWKETTDTYHFYDDVRTITFSAAVDPATLGQISIFNETTEQPVATIAELGTNDDQIIVKLADGTEYSEHHIYTLTVQGVKQKENQLTIKPTKYTYKMVYKTPEEVQFANSYIVKNTSGTGKQFELPAGATYVTYDQYGIHDYSNDNGIQIRHAKTIYLAEDEQMTVSFSEENTLVQQDGFTIQQTSEPSHTVYKLYERNSVSVTGEDRQSQPDIYFGNADETVYASYAEYSLDLEAEDFKYRLKMDKDFKSKLLYSLNNMIITNEDNGILYVYAPNTAHKLTSVKAVDEKAVVHNTLAPKEKLIANSTELTSQTGLNFKVPQGDDWKISFAAYDQDDVFLIAYDQQTAAYIRTGFDTIIKNEVDQPLTVTGPARYVTFAKTEEEPLTFYELNQNDKVKIMSNLKENHGVYIYEPSNKGTYSSIQYRNDEVNRVSLHEAVYQYGNTGFDSSTSLVNIIENVGKASQLLYGPKRAITFEKYTEELFNKIELAPGEKVEVKANKETSYYFKDATRKGLYTITDSLSTKQFSFSYETEADGIEPNESKWFENTGKTPISLFGVKDEINIIR